MVDRRLTGNTLHLYLNPERSSHPDAFKVHGLSDEFLADKPRFADVVDQLVAFVEGAELIIHNAAFDLTFVNAELRRLGRGLVTDVVAKVCDSLLMAREMFPGKANSLDALCRRLEVDNSNRALHGALLDARLLAEVYIRMTRPGLSGHRQPRQQPRAAAAGADRPAPVRSAGAGCPCRRSRRARSRAERPGQGQWRQDSLEECRRLSVWHTAGLFRVTGSRLPRQHRHRAVSSAESTAFTAGVAGSNPHQEYLSKSMSYSA
jgi:DNA polymerase III epsilon subunit